MAQVTMSRLLASLMKLNPKAQNLIQQKKRVELEIKVASAAFQPELVLALQAERALILAQQSRLRMEQDLLLLEAERQRRQVPLVFTASIKGQTTKKLTPSNGAINLAVLRTHPEEVASPFHVAPDFFKRQMTALRWQLDLLRDVPRDWLSRLQLSPFLFNGQCAATLEQKESRWIPKLRAAGKF